MKKRVNVSVFFFVILGAMEGILLSLVAAGFMDSTENNYMIKSYTEWLGVLIPVFAIIGSLFNLASAVFLYDDDTQKPKKRFIRKKKKA